MFYLKFKKGNTFVQICNLNKINKPCLCLFISSKKKIQKYFLNGVIKRNVCRTPFALPKI